MIKNFKKYRSFISDAIMVLIFTAVATTVFAQDSASLSKDLEKQQKAADKAADKARKENEKREKAEQAKAEQTAFDEWKAKNLKIEDDEFSSNRKVILLPQAVAPNLTVSLEYKRFKTTAPDPIGRLTDYCTVTFVNTSGKWEYTSEENEFNFLVDGQRVHGGLAHSNITSKVYSNANKEEVVGVIDVSNLRRATAGKEIKMKIGDNVFVLDQKLIRALKFYADEVSK